MIEAKVQAMIDNPGIYVIGSIFTPSDCSVIWSHEGHLTVMKKDVDLDPTRFNLGMIVKHGPLK